MVEEVKLPPVTTTTLSPAANVVAADTSFTLGVVPATTSAELPSESLEYGAVVRPPTENATTSTPFVPLVEKSVMTSAPPELPVKMILSLPNPPVMVLALVPVPPLITSSPAPPTKLSADVLPVIVSAPDQPMIVAAAATDVPPITKLPVIPVATNVSLASLVQVETVNAFEPVATTVFPVDVG